MNLTFNRVRLLFGTLALAALIAGCGAESPPEPQESGAAAPAVVEPTAAPPLAELPTVTPNVAAAAPTAAAPAQAAAPVDWTTHAYQEGDYYILGNPDAPVRLIDYSDFL